jgi:glycosyltransferase involved in cell wall biosynthesis
VISNGVDKQIFHPLKKNEDAMFNILSVGRLDPEKNISMLLEVLRILK